MAKELAISDHTYYRWRREYGGIRTDQAKRLKMLGKENDRLKKLVADLSLDNAILKGCSGGKLVSLARRRAAVERVLESSRVLNNGCAECWVSHDRPRDIKCRDCR